MASDDKIKLRLMGLSYSQLQSGAYALILAQVDGPVRIPVVIGASEAQSIAIKLEGITPPRPLTHDLFASFVQAFGIKLKELFIYKFEDGIFSSELTFSDGTRTVQLDSRTSDAIAIALRTGTPIYTTRSILEETGFVLENDPTVVADSNTTSEESDMEPRIENLAIEELEKMLDRLIDNEEYEEAQRIKILLDENGNPLEHS
ncbi:MAG: bifunctional nuclease family protein [Muribaculaceae bacterium]|nr:bifunctional nuclease family protein [Muribaculaceae bacterium]